MTRALPALLLAACTAAPPEDDVPAYAPPTGATTADHDPARLSTFPDALHTVAADTVTGVRVRLTDEAEVWLDALLPPGFTLVEALEDLDGFGTTAGVILSFSAPVDPTSFAASTRFLDLASGEAIAFGVDWTDEGRTAIVEPLQPLAPGTEHAVLVDADLVDLDGEPVWRDVALDQAMTGRLAGAPATLTSRWEAALERTDLAPDDLAHGTVFPTQSLHAQDEAAVGLLRELGPSLQAGGCTSEGTARRCDAVLTVHDLLGPDGFVEAGEALVSKGTYTVPVAIWLPLDGDGPHPVVLHGHGLGGDRFEARGDTRVLVEEGWAVVALDAPRHGEHPLASSGELFWILEFFGIFAELGGMEIRILRDDFRLAAWEKLQLVDVLDGFDADADGDADLDAGVLAFTGHSLGGVMGPQPVAMDPRFRSVFLSVPGGRVSEIVHRGEIFAPLIALMAPPGASAGDIDRFFPMLQAAIERGDPLVWAPRVLDGTRDVLVQQVIDDDIMPGLTTRALARALGVEHVGEVLEPVVGLARGAAELPVAGNLGGRTGVLHQWALLRDDGEEAPVPATHTQIFGSDSNHLQLGHWFRTWRDDGVPEILDPLAP
jgi:dienelactone hydrolase